jgi:hypothetical protein
VLFDQNNSKFIVNDPLSVSLNLNIEVSLIDYHKLRIDLEHDSGSFFEDFIPELEIIILVIEDIKGKHLYIDDAILTHWRFILFLYKIRWVLAHIF